jgi:outer membrane protein assembly factor BamD (BamD/ComL family)
MLVTITGCQLFKKKVPPHELFAEAEQLRKDGEFVEAALRYDELYEQYDDSELAPAALYYTGICRYSMSIRCPGKQAFDQQKAELSKNKKEEYEQCIEYMEKHKKPFMYDENVDTFLYNGADFLGLIEQFPSSDLVDDAAFQYVRNQIVGKQQLKTLTVSSILAIYGDFFERYPQSPYRRNGMEDMLKLMSEYSGALIDAAAVAEAYKKFLPFQDDLPELAKLTYVISKRLVEEGADDAAANLLGQSSIIGLGVVETARTRLNIRGGQGTQHRIIAKAEKGEEVLVLENTGDWYAVLLEDGTQGYAHREYIQLLE